MGYRLFARGIYEPAGDLEATWRNNRLLLKRAAPGIFFALFAVAALAIAIWRPVSLERYPENAQQSTGPVTQAGVAASIPPAVAAIFSKAIEGQPLSDDEHATARKWLDGFTAVSSAPEMRIQGTAPPVSKKKAMEPVDLNLKDSQQNKPKQ